jgi:MFS family permease
LINTHLIAYCADHGIAAVTGASVLAALGVFRLIGSTLSGWLCDRFNPRALLFWYYSLRGISLIVVPFSEFDFVSLSIFSIFYGLDWVATGPATFALTNEVFGRRDTPVILSFPGYSPVIRLAALWQPLAPVPYEARMATTCWHLSLAAWPAWWRRCWFCV